MWDTLCIYPVTKQLLWMCRPVSWCFALTQLELWHVLWPTHIYIYTYLMLSLYCLINYPIHRSCIALSLYLFQERIHTLLSFFTLLVRLCGHVFAKSRHVSDTGGTEEEQNRLRLLYACSCFVCLHKLKTILLPLVLLAYWSAFNTKVMARRA